MPYALILIAVLLIVVGIRDKVGELGALLKADFTGANNFIYWFSGLVAVGSIGYSTTFRPASRAFMTLILLSMIIADRGFFARLKSDIDTLKPSPSADEAAVGKASTDNITSLGFSDLVNPQVPTVTIDPNSVVGGVLTFGQLLPKIFGGTFNDK